MSIPEFSISRRLKVPASHFRQIPSTRVELAKTVSRYVEDEAVQVTPDENHLSEMLPGEILIEAHFTAVAERGCHAHSVVDA